MSIQTINFFAVVLLTFSSLFATAQTSEQAVSSITEKQNAVSAAWENVQKLTYTYTENGQLETALSQSWDIGSQEWINFASCSSEYDSYGDLLSSDCLYWNQETSNWENSERMEFTSDAVAILSWDEMLQDWNEQLVNKEAHTIAKSAQQLSYDHMQDVKTTYDNKGRVSQQLANTTTQGSVGSMRTSYLYNEGTAKTDLAFSTELRNYPNPVVSTTQIEFSLEEASNVMIQLYDAQGKMVNTIANQDFTGGTQTIGFDASALVAGMYHYTLTVDGASVATNSMLVAGN